MLLKNEISWGRVMLAASRDECTDPGTKFQGDACKVAKCGNGAGGC